MELLYVSVGVDASEAESSGPLYSVTASTVYYLMNCDD